MIHDNDVFKKVIQVFYFYSNLRHFLKQLVSLLSH